MIKTGDILKKHRRVFYGLDGRAVTFAKPTIGTLNPV